MTEQKDLKRALLVVNPSSGGEKAPEFEDMAQEMLASYFDEVEVKHTEKAGDAAAFAKQAARDRYDSVFVMGGDGTVNEGISGLAEEEYRPKFGFFPLGTVNDLARALGIPLDPEEAIQTLDVSNVEPLDIGKINDSYFMNVVGIGTIPEAINDTEVEEKTKFGKLAYFISGFKKLTSSQSYQFQLSIDGKEEVVESSTLLIGSTNSIGGFEQLLPHATAHDGKLHLIYLKDKSLFDTIKAVPDLIRGVDESTDHVAYRDFQTLEVSLLESDKQLKTNVDGDEGDALPVKIKVLPAHLEVHAGKRKQPILFEEVHP